MRIILLSAFALFLLLPENIQAQVTVKTGYISSSRYKDENGQYPGKGDMCFVEGNVNIPVSQKMNERNQPTLWMISAGGSYTAMNNKNLQSYIDIDQIINMQLSVTNIRPISKKWLLLTTVGAGVYTSSDVKLKNVLGQGGVIFIRQFKSNLSLGAGLAVNNTFGYPMVFPAIYFDWSTEGRYQIKVSMLNAMEVSAGMKMNKYLNLRIVAEMNGSLALLEREGKDTMFSQQFIIVGLQPEVSMGNSFSITATAGVSCSRIAYYTTRTLKAFFEELYRLMSVKILLYTLLKQIGIFLVVSFLVFRGTFVESDSLGLNLSTGVSLLLSVILWGIINLHTYWLIPGYLFQRRYKKYIIYLSCLVGFMLTAMVGAICFLGQYYVIPEQKEREITV